MNGPRIGGIEPPETTPLPPPPTPAPPPEGPAIPAENSLKPKNSRTSGLGTLVLAIVALIAVGAAGYYACHLQKQMIQLQSRLNAVQAVARDSLGKVDALKIPKDLTVEVNGLEISINKLRTADDAIRKNLTDEVQKIPAVETRLSETDRALAARIGETESALSLLRSGNESRLTNIIAILKNQDRILRRLTARPATEGEQP